jgi:hypothetical protein
MLQQPLEPRFAVPHQLCARRPPPVGAVHMGEISLTRPDVIGIEAVAQEHGLDIRGQDEDVLFTRQSSERLVDRCDPRCEAHVLYVYGPVTPEGCWR